MKSYLKRACLALSITLLLGGCFHVQLDGSVVGATLTITPLHGGGEAILMGPSIDEEFWIAAQGEELWSSYLPILRLAFVGIVLLPDDLELDPDTLYLVTASGGEDFDPNLNRALTDTPVAVQGEWHAIVKGQRIMDGNLKVSVMTEAVYQQVKDDIDSSTDAAIMNLLEAAAEAVVMTDIDNDGLVNYNDVLFFNRLLDASAYPGDMKDVNALANAITDGSASETVSDIARIAVGQDFDGINGGRLYASFWARETGFTLANSMLTSQEQLDRISAQGDFFSCTQCHGWDRLGTEGGHSNRAPNPSRPRVSFLDLESISAAYSSQQLFDAIKTGSIMRRGVDEDMSSYHPMSNPGMGNMMPDYSQILTDGQIWDMVAFLKREALDTTQLYDITLGSGAYPDRDRTFSNLGNAGDAANGDAIYADDCGGCHGADGAAFLVDGGQFTVGAFSRVKPDENQHKVKFGDLGTSMGAIMADSPLSDIQDLFAAMADVEKYPD